MIVPRTAFFLINLDRSPERLRQATIRLDALGIPFTRIAAVDGSGLRPVDHPTYGDREARALMGRSLVGGEIGCVESHRRALSAFLESGADHGVVLEDDARLEPAFASMLDLALRLVENHDRRDWRVLHLGDARLRFSKTIGRLEVGSTSHLLLSAHYFPMGAFALCWSRAGAREFLALGDAIDAPFDNMLQNWLCRRGGGLAIRPPLATVTEAASDIDGTPRGIRPSRGTRSRSTFAGLIKQRRLWRNRFWAFAHRIGFAGRS